MKIGELAKITATAVETIRYYERAGLLPLPARSTGNYRLYDDSHVECLSFIRHCRGLDMTLDEIRVLLHFRDAPNADCGEVDALLDDHIGHVSERIRELRALETELKELRSLCREAQQACECGILGGLTRRARSGTRSADRAASHLGGVHGRPEQRRK